MFSQVQRFNALFSRNRSTSAHVLFAIVFHLLPEELGDGGVNVCELRNHSIQLHLFLGHLVHPHVLVRVEQQHVILESPDVDQHAERAGLRQDLSRLVQSVIPDYSILESNACSIAVDVC